MELAGELDGWRAKIDYRGPIPRTWAGRLRRDLEAEAVAASTSMVKEAVIAVGLQPRVAHAVWDAFFGRSVTPRYYRPLADVSPGDGDERSGCCRGGRSASPRGQGKVATVRTGR